ncbi:MAG: hypothetical protein JWN44_4970 [Myxococcales bacterium]|nr:hypothetical protein [Myxococcales bacterium]
MRWLVLALVGAAICTVCDHLHATHGVLWYPHPVFWEQAWWVPLLFAGASLAVVGGATPIRRALGGRQEPAPTARQVAGDGIAFITAYAYTSFAPPDQPNVTLALLVAWWVARVVRDRPTWLIVFSLLTAVAGTAFEATWSALGFFHYRHPDLFGVARWLPGIYLHVGLLAGPLERVLKGADE